MKSLRLLLALGLSGSMIAACSSTTLIRSSDPEAKIYVDGQLMGKGSVSYTDTKIVGSSTSITLKKEGCEPKVYTMTRTEAFDAGACAGGVFVMVPFLWIMKYNPEHSYEFECEKHGASNRTFVSPIAQTNGH